MNTFNIRFKWVGGATWILKVDDLKIASDPVLCPKNTELDFKIFKAVRTVDPVFEATDFAGIDFWLMTHSHLDHIDKEGLSKIEQDTRVYAHHNLEDWFRKRNSQPIQYLKWGDKTVYRKDDISVEIEAIPCVHGSNFVSAKLTGGVNGYWLTFRKRGAELTIYLTADTIWHRKVRKALKGRKARILVPNMGASALGKFGGPFTLTADLLSHFTEAVKPEIILPIHHSTFSMLKEPIEKLYQRNDERVLKFQEGEEIVIN